MPVSRPNIAKSKESDSSGSSLRIAVCGIRGIPACYGGFETFAEELCPRLVALGHKVVVYGRSHVIDHSEPTYKGVEIRLLSAPQHKYFETPVHTLKSLIDLVRRPVDVILVCNAANSPFVWIPRLFGMPVAVNLDGIERRRSKWNAFGRAWYLLGEICSVLFATRMIADAAVIQDYYKRTYRRGSEVIRYGCHKLEEETALKKISSEELSTEKEAQELFDELGIRSQGYLLYVSRLEPENNAHVLIEAYNGLNDEEKRLPLVIVGDAPYAKSYIEALHAAAGPNIIFAGYRFGASYTALQEHAYCYVQATEVGGTHPALVEAMGFANCVIANSTPENREVLSDAGLFYSKNDAKELGAQLQCLISDSDITRSYRQKAYQRAQEHFDWDKITNRYEGLFYALAKRERVSKASVSAS